jgi:surfactin synthase thioesterase subunit
MTASARIDEWSVRFAPRPHATVRLMCAPHTGGGAVVYRDWARRMPADIEVVALRLPGREARFRQPPYTSLDDLLPDLLAAVEPALAQPHAWFGHSMGALIAFEACRRSAADPVALLVSGRPAPDLPVRLTPVHGAPPAAVVQRLRDLGGTPSDVFADPDVVATLLPTLRADFTVAETYRYQPGPPLRVPVAVLGGAADPLTNDTELAAWARHTTADTTVRIFAGDHFYLHRNPDVLPAVVASLRAAVEARRPR